MGRSGRIGIMLGVLAVALVIAWWVPPVPQDPAYHRFADARPFLGVPNALNVLSNLAFLIAGGAGLGLALGASGRVAFVDGRERWPWVVFFAGLALTGFGSAWYHAQPNDATLVWDRLPMALGFAGLVAGTLTDREPRWIWQWLFAFAVVGAGTVLYWHVTANLVPYLVMQAGFMAATLIATAYIPTRYTHANRIYAAAGLYALALIFERLDHQVHALLGGWISGHTLKHLLACAAIVIVYAMLRERCLSD